MKVFSKIKREVPLQRRKYGKPETKQENLQRQKEERELRNKKIELLEGVEQNNKQEFHFAYHSMKNNLVKKIFYKKDELKKILKYVDCEINRVEEKTKNSMKFTNKSNKIVFSDDIKEKEEKQPSAIKKGEYEEYLEELILKRKEISDLIINFKE